jgi:signal transduction histidine kinase
MPDRSPEGEIASWLGTYTDIDEQKKAEEERAELLRREQAARTEAEWAHRRALFLSEASIYLASSLDYRTTLSRVANLAVPDLADWCAVYLLDEHRVPVRVAIAEYATPAERPLHPLRIEKDGHLLRSIQMQQSVLLPEIPDDFLEANAESEEHLEALRSAGLKSCIIVPLFARQNQMGVMIFSSSRLVYAHDDLLVAEELARRAAQAVDNAKLYREAQDAIVLRDEFLSIASHELKTPLTALRLQLEHTMLSSGRRGNPEFTPTTLRRLAGCEQAVDRVAKLIDQLLDVTRIRSGRLQLEKEPIDISALVQDVVAGFENELAKTGSTATLGELKPILAVADRFRMEQVITNLLNNAIKYGAGAPIEVEVVQTAGALQVRVRDHGIGIAKENQSRVFERFERAVSSRDFGGLGLGLFITKQIVEAHGGTIHVESELGEGSLFWIEIPLDSQLERQAGALAISKL